MKKVKQTNQNSPTDQISNIYDAQLNQDRTHALQLYEKGILSSDSLLEKMGYDSDREIKRKKDAVIQASSIPPSCNEVPNWSILSNKIEQARRNVEVAAKIMGERSSILDGNTMKQLEETLLDSLEILKETSNIK